jgi:hypothetical protein
VYVAEAARGASDALPPRRRRDARRRAVDGLAEPFADDLQVADDRVVAGRPPPAVAP